ncbi:heme-thiolate peroxidase [Crepidotus variabilis]|uniref:Heme-thiolate peroxidase n=1 Tax=Crepidotus variabilis TaxID=179855 RepID=A0A9P6EFY1_9AGAR|nr:heme-thiolate peroxidase [Crepidotus variabilis]
MKILPILSSLAFAAGTSAFPAYGSLAGFGQEALNIIIPTLLIREPPPLRPGDIRGPCPGLNTLASHGYLPRNGMASPSQIVAAVQEGFNMENSLAVFVAYAAHLVDGNLLTDLMSIGGKSHLTGPDPPPPATAGGLNTHAVFEGDASMTRGDFFFGNNHDLDTTLWDQFVDFSVRFGAGNYNFTVAAELRHQRIQESIATNPSFSLVSPRYYTAFVESVFPIAFFVDGRKNDSQLDLSAASSFFLNNSFPPDFFRANGPRTAKGIDQVFEPYPILPGGNVGKINTYTVDPTSADFSNFCLLYTNFVNETIRGLYPEPTGVLRRALNTNLNYFYQGINNSGCTQIFPYGKD